MSVATVGSAGVPDARRVVIVTGATSGLGRATAVLFAARGASVVAAGRRVPEGEALVQEVADTGGDLAFVATDVRRVDDCEALAAAAMDRYGRIDVLVNNAGTEGEEPIVDSHEVTEAQWDDVVDTNLKGAFFCCRYALAHMRRRQSGVVLNIASINAIEGPARMAAYSASKAALVQLSRTLAVEYVHDGIRVNAVVVGGVDTPQAERTRAAIRRHVLGTDDPPVPPAPKRRNPLVYAPDEAARTLVLLADDDALMTGATIALDRAMTAGSMASTMIYMTSAGIWTKPY
jgi:NAD(P)-dependent dehydrogenase (short-subunit alcohol dehydrogenase family)